MPTEVPQWRWQFTVLEVSINVKWYVVFPILKGVPSHTCALKPTGVPSTVRNRLFNYVFRPSLSPDYRLFEHCGVVARLNVARPDHDGCKDCWFPSFKDVRHDLKEGK